MMMNIFSIFDPSTSISISLNWLSLLIMLVMLPYSYWLIPSRINAFWGVMISFLLKEFKPLIQYSYSNLLIFASLFSMIIINNFMGLFPYVFTASSHMSFCLPLSFTLWLGMLIYSIINYPNNFCSHLTPQSTPYILSPFMVIIESISYLIRPFTLAIRLTANMIAGHMLLSLLGTSGMTASFLLLPLVVFMEILLFSLELAVSMIQAYVFSVLSTLYSSEI